MSELLKNEKISVNRTADAKPGGILAIVTGQVSPTFNTHYYDIILTFIRALSGQEWVAI